MTANSERKKRKKKENLLFSLASMEKKRKEKGELEREREILSSSRRSFHHLCSLKVLATRPATKTFFRNFSFLLLRF